MGATKDGKIQALKVKTIADHGYSDAAADPSKFPAGLFNVITGSYDFDKAFVEVDGVYTNKPPGGVAYRCSFRVTEAVHAIERMVDILAHDIGKDPAQLRMENFIQPEQFPYHTPTGWDYDSGDYPRALQLALDTIGYDDLRREQAEKRARGELMGIGISSFTEIVGAGPSHDFDILGLKMFDSCEIRVHPTGKVLARIGVQTQGQGHETTFAQIIAEELGFPVSDIKIEYGDTDTAPYGLGTYASRSTPVAGAATAVMASRKIRTRRRSSPRTCSRRQRRRPRVDERQVLRQGLARPGQDDPGDRVRGLHEPSRRDGGRPRGGRLLRPAEPDVPVRVVHLRRRHRQGHRRRSTIRRFVAVDDCGNIINPMIVDGQIHGGLTMGLAPALYEAITYDENGNNLAGTFMDYLLPTAVETPDWELAKTVTPSPHHPIGAKGVGESATVGAPPAIANAVVDALWHLGVRNIDIPITPQKVWAILREKGVTAYRPVGRARGTRASNDERAPLTDRVRRRGRGRSMTGTALGLDRVPAAGRNAGRSRTVTGAMTARNLFDRAAELSAAGRLRVRDRRAVARPTSAGPARTASSIPTARSRAGSAARAPSRSSFARRSTPSPTASRACSASRRTRRPRVAGPMASSSSSCPATPAGPWRSTWNRTCPSRCCGSPASTPIAGALVELGAAAGFKVTLFDPIADARRVPGRGRGPD